ncbi:4Fe-4S dicluster domain-containing protein [Geomonas sp.]|uniref:4Fe-4S dicluster domain-containing protein n=1 Tax=Geomonas sp. TaxID=2651584 RepID=UPI002B476E2D|nr:4Fe-4S dicluster domain-containing protein [Geomonas sp.]HJV36021.1 4Fe-4S dicluster domain-containing protein [Geomonas sp.]
MNPGQRIAPKRKLFQWLSTLLLLVIPFLKINGESLLRLDAASRSLLFFGATIRIDEFYLFLLAVLICIFLFLFITLLFGRVWCGWACPQTTLGDIAEWVEEKCASLTRLKAVSALLRQVVYLALAALVASNLLWYFVPPDEFFARVASGRMGTAAGMLFATTFLLVYLDLALVKRSFCKTLCPYGRVQFMTMEPGTLTLEFDPARTEECLRCGACLRVCPMGIDIREGAQVECINCGRCLDACRDVMEGRGGQGLIHYTFGKRSERGWRANWRAILFGGVSLLLVVTLIMGVARREEATLSVRMGANGEVKRLSDGSLVNFYLVYLENRSSAPSTFTLAVEPVPGSRMELIGPVNNILLQPNDNRKLTLALKVSPSASTVRTVELRLLKGGRVVAHAALPVLMQ